MDLNDPTSLSTIVANRSLRLKPDPDQITEAEAIEELVDMVSFYIDDPAEEGDLDACERALNQEIRAEFPGHQATVGRADETTARVVVRGPRFNVRLLVTAQTIQFQED